MASTERFRGTADVALSIFHLPVSFDPPPLQPLPPLCTYISRRFHHWWRVPYPQTLQDTSLIISYAARHPPEFAFIVRLRPVSIERRKLSPRLPSRLFSGDTDAVIAGISPSTERQRDRLIPPLLPGRKIPSNRNSSCTFSNPSN